MHWVAGTDGLNSVGMITGRMEVRNWQVREGGRGEEGERKLGAMCRLLGGNNMHRGLK